MDHSAHQRHGEVQFEVLLLVPQQRRGAVSIIDAEIREGGSEPASALRAIRERCAVDRAVRAARDYPAAPAEALGALH